MAPSRSDYAGARRGLVIFLAVIGASTLLLALVLKYNPQFAMWLVAAISALLSLLMLTVILCAVASAAVYVVTHLFPVRFEHI
jgi:multisubunit Na+/H+ antiporter MnhB subunit